MASKSTTRVTVTDIASALDRLAPFSLAEDWDNVGLLCGRPEWPVSRALVAIDLTDAVADESLQKSVDLIVAYHPPIFKGIKGITADAACPTSRLPDLLAAKTSILSLHTALDSAVGGTNDVLLDAFSPVERYPLEPAVHGGRDYKLVLFAPPDEIAGLRQALSRCGAGVIGHYTECSYEIEGRGTFRGDETTNPTVGRKQVLEHLNETRLEMVVPRRAIGPVIRTLVEAHSYEEPAFDLYPIESLAEHGAVGMGRVGRLARPQCGTDLLKTLGDVVDLAEAHVVGDLRRKFRSITAAAGAFGVRSFRDPDSLVLTGEFKHHDALDLLKRGVTAIHLGHWQSERPVRKKILDHLRRQVRGLRAEISRKDRSPFSPVQ